MSLPDVFKGRLSIPVIGSPLFIISNPDLVIAQCKAGVVGSFPSLNARPDVGGSVHQHGTGLRRSRDLLYEPRGHEFHGQWLGPFERRIELIELARRCGIRTQFMSHDEESARAVFGQILTVLRRVVAQPRIFEQ